MGGFAVYIGTALALVLVIEGLFYGLFPEAARRMMALALSIPPGQFRAAGFSLAGLGFAIVYGLSLLSP